MRATPRLLPTCRSLYRSGQRGRAGILSPPHRRLLGREGRGKKEQLKEDEEDNARAPDPGVGAPVPQVLEEVVELVLADYIVTYTLVLPNFWLDGAFSVQDFLVIHTPVLAIFW